MLNSQDGIQPASKLTAKVCSCCGIVKNINNYKGKWRKRINGKRFWYILPYCIECCRKKEKIYNESKARKQSIYKYNQSEKRKKISKKYIETDKGKQTHKKAAQKYYASGKGRDKLRKHLKANSIKYRANPINKKKIEARTILNNAIKYNRLQKDQCEKCDSLDNIHAHHKDYNKPLDVNWLCAVHHNEIHRKCA